MSSNLYCEMIETMPNGLACFEVIFDEFGNSIDCIFVSMNDAFGEVIGLTNSCIGKKISDLFSLNTEGIAQWIEILGQVVKTGESQIIEHFVKELKIYYQVTIYNIDKKNVAVILHDVTGNKHVEMEKSKLKDEYEAIFNSTQDAMFFLDVDRMNTFKYRRINKCYEAATGLTSFMVQGKTPKELFGEELGTSFEANYIRCIINKAPITYEETLTILSGTKTWLSVLSPIIRDGQVVQIVGASRDITERQNFLEALKESEQKYYSLFYNNFSVMIIFDPKNGDIIDANPSACSYYGYTKQEITNINISKINTLSLEELFIEMKKAQNNEQNYFYFKHRLKNGIIRDVESFSSPIKIKNHDLVCSIVHDITNRRIAEELLHEEKERLDITLHSIGDAVITTDNKGKTLLINKAAENITGWTKEEAYGKYINEFLIIKQDNILLDSTIYTKRVSDSNKAIEIFNDAILTTRSNEEKRISGSGAPIKDVNGRIQGIAIVFRDETEKRKNEEQLIYLSFHDSLTGLYNRAFYDVELNRLNTKRQLPLSIMIGDVNGLKLTNDVFGHAEGDKLLINISDILRQSCRDEDIIARWGGDEFAVLLPRTSNEEALKIRDRIKEKCNNSDIDPIKPSIALGISTKIDPSQDIKQILTDAEDKMYRNKLKEGKQVRSEIVLSLQNTLAKRCIDTIDHSERMKELVLKVGNAMHLTERDKDALSMVSILHDIGYIGVPAHIINKHGKLTEEEMSEVKKHPEIGFRVAQSTPELSHIAEIILTHHERWDGKGYPLGLEGKQIPKLSRLIAIIDSYDSMTNDKHYKKALSHSEAIEELKRCSGTQFDPVLVNTFIEAVNSK